MTGSSPGDPSALLDPLERFGMKAGTSANDHGPFKAAATVAPVDVAPRDLIVVPDGDVVSPPEVPPTLIVDVVYRTLPSGSTPLELRADVLVPDGVGPFPIVVFVPGGGFVRSPKDAASIRRTAVAARGFVVVSVEYRTLRHGTYRDGVDDVAAAVGWVRDHADGFRGDPERLALWGESAGGYLAALAVTTGTVRHVSAVVDTFGLTDLSRVAMDFDAAERARHLTAEIPEAQYVFGRHSGLTVLDDPDEVQRANPVAHVSGTEPPFLLLHGEIDGLVSPGQSRLLHEALLGAGVPSTRLVVAGAGHYGIEWSSGTVLDRIIEFLAERLR
ncbi:MAG: alpha/beta hydrolase fold domain-containing protein [Ilumatobacteraceae bacterium]